MGARTATDDDIPSHGMDWTAWLLAFKGVLLEGLEVTIIVVTFGAAARAFPTAALAAAAALVVIGGAGALARRGHRAHPAQRPATPGRHAAVRLRHLLGGGGARIAWPGEDLSIIALVAWYVLAATGYIRRLRRQTQHARQLAPSTRGEP